MDFHPEFSIQTIEKLSFHLPHVYIIGRNHCESKRRYILEKGNNYDRKSTFHYVGRFQVLSEKVHSK